MSVADETGSLDAPGRQRTTSWKMALRADLHETSFTFFDILSAIGFLRAKGCGYGILPPRGKSLQPRQMRGFCVRFRRVGKTDDAESDSMKSRHTESPIARTQDKQLGGIILEIVLEKRRLGQAMNVKEFAVCVGVSYSTARAWFHIPGFPVFHGVIFWQDFDQWRISQNGLEARAEKLPKRNGVQTATGLPPRAARILLDA